MKLYSKLFALLLATTVIISGCVSDKNTSKADSTPITSNPTTSVTSDSNDVSSVEEFSYEFYKAATEKTDKLNAIDGSFKEQYDIDMNGIMLPVPIESYYKIDFANKEVGIQQNEGASGSETIMSLYFSDGYAYKDFMGTKTKTASSFESVIANNIRSGMIEETVAKSSGELIVDGIKYHKITVAGKDFLASDMASSVRTQIELFATDVDYDKVEIGDVDMLILYEDGYIAKIKTSTQLSYSDGEVEINLEYSSDRTLNNIGDSVVINAPEDLDQYVDFEM